MRYLLVDRIAEIEEGRRVVGWKSVAMSEDYLEWHFPDQPIVPGVLVLEAFAQLAGWLEAKTSGFERWALLDRLSSARYYGFAGPGDRIELRLEQIAHQDPERRAYRGEAFVGTERRAAVEFEATTVSLESLESRERAERSYRVLLGLPQKPPGRKGGG
jgi:3-hydroxyacyl-[acyl-carrier-protein] dehydratase